MVLAAVTPTAAGKLQARNVDTSLVVWPVNPMVKVFQDDAPPRAIGPAQINLARNEKEPLQLAVRSPVEVRQVSVAVDAPVNVRGDKLLLSQVAVVGYVHIDARSPGGSDGWAGSWPDPLLPRSVFDLALAVTQPVWITVAAPKGAPPGDYAGRARLVSNGMTLKEAPFVVHVWDFDLPDENHLPAMFGVSVGKAWQLPGKGLKETQYQWWRFLAEHRLNPRGVGTWGYPVPAPAFKYEKGRVTADFSQFDAFTSFLFGELKVTRLMGYGFQLIGWATPPPDFFGERPYEGTPPYEGVDRGKFRPEYKRVVQAAMKVFWDHLKEKGWDARFVIELGDEPPLDNPAISAQLKAACNLLHEVDPKIPLYCSTWSHNPEWDGYLDIWGIGHYGGVSPEKIRQLQAAGYHVWFTIDGQDCIDTPYCEFERLIPYYCFKYHVEAYEFWSLAWGRLAQDTYEFRLAAEVAALAQWRRQSGLSGRAHRA